MSIRSTSPFLREHARLRDHVEHLPVMARSLSRMTDEERADAVEHLVSFIAEILLPHCAAEEHVCPEAATLLGEQDESDTVALDSERVRELLARLSHADASDVGTLQEITLGLYTLLAAHMWREEELYLKLAAGRWDPRREAVLAELTSDAVAAPE